jgi:hypothetical protein
MKVKFSADFDKDDRCESHGELAMREEENGMPSLYICCLSRVLKNYLLAASLSVKEIISNKVSWLDLLEMD